MTARHARAARPADRNSLLGLWQLGHPVQGVPAGGRAPQPVGEDRGRGDRAPVHRRGADAWPCTSRGTRSTTTPTSPSTPRDAGRRAGHHQLQRVPGQRLQARQRDQPGPGVSGARRPTTCSSASTSWTRTGSRDLKLWFSDGTNYPGQDDVRDRARTGWPTALARDLRPARAATSGCCWSTSCSSRPSTRPTCRTGARPTRTASSSGERAKVCHRHRAPRAGHQHRVHRGVPAAGGQARRVRLQLPLLRRRRPDGRRGRPVPAVPDHARDRAWRRARPGARHRVHARPVPQHRAEDPGGDPLGDERAGGHGQGAAGRPGRAAHGPGRRATCWPPTPCSWTPTTPTSARCCASCASEQGLDPDPSRPTAQSGYPERIAAERAGGQQAGWGA